MTIKTKKKTFDCIQFKESLQAAMWKKSKASNLEEYVAWLKKETSEFTQERCKAKADSSLTDDEKIDVVAKRVLERYRSAFEELAK